MQTKSKTKILINEKIMINWCFVFSMANSFVSKNIFLIKNIKMNIWRERISQNYYSRDGFQSYVVF
jgi:hypothetical protein